jgi:hypothetical protein
VKAPLILSLLALLVAGCASLKETDHQPDVSGRYTEPFDPDLADVYELVSREELEFFPDGRAVNRWILGKKMRDILGTDLVVAERRDGQKIYVIKTTGTWRFEGKRLVFQGQQSLAVFEDVRPWPAPFTGLKSLLAPNKPRPTRYDFRVDTNGDLLRIPPRGHPYYAGRFVKQK